MADSILRLKVESQEYDNKLKQATNGLTRYIDECRKVGGTLEVVQKDTLDYVRAIGRMDTTSRTATGKLAEMKKTFTELSVVYKNMTDQEKSSPFGKALAASLDQLKPRIQESKAQLESINNELSGSKFGQFGGMIDSLGQKMGLNANITELLTSKTALLSAGLGAAGAIVGKATQEWAKYNAELAKQDQITTVTTGLKGPDSDRMTNQARALTDTYGVDFRETINAANTLMTQFGQTGEQAMSLIRDGMQGMIQGDGPKLLSMIQQYAPAFRDAGVSASQLVAVIQNSEGGIFTDQNMNAIVMGIKNIRLMTNATSEALGKLGIDGQRMSQQLRDGSLTIFDALKQVATQIQGVNSNSQAAGEVMQQVFGRQGAMAGTKLGEAIATLNTNLEETKRQTGEVGDAYNDLYKANVKLNGAIRDCFEYDGWDQMATGIKANLVSALASVLDLLGKIKGALGGFSVNQQQGETRNGGGQFIDRAVDRLRGGNTPGKQNIYTRQIQAYSGKILDINDQIRQIQEKAAQDMDGNMAMVYEKQIRNLENRKQAIQRNMAEYDKRAKAVLNGTDTKSATITNPVKTVTTPKTNTPKGSGNVKEEKDDFEEIIGLIPNAQEAVRSLQQQISQSWDEGEIAKLTADLKVAQNELQRLQNIGKETSMVQGLSGFNQETMSAWMQGRQSDLSKAEYGSADYKSIKDNIADMTTIKAILEESVNAGINAAEFNMAPMWGKIFGEAMPEGMEGSLSEALSKMYENAFDQIDIDDSAFETIVEVINEKCEKLGIKPIQIPIETTNQDVKALQESARTTANVVGTIGQAFNNIEDPAARVAGVVAQAIANIALAYSDALAKDKTSKFNIWGFLAASAASLISMTTAISQVHSSTGYAEGGVIKGNSYSGDNIPIMANAGEVVLTKAMTNNLAAGIQSQGMGGWQLKTRLAGTDLLLSVERTLQKQGYGKLATWG